MLALQSKKCEIDFLDFMIRFDDDVQLSTNETDNTETKKDLTKKLIIEDSSTEKQENERFEVLKGSSYMIDLRDTRLDKRKSLQGRNLKILNSVRPRLSHFNQQYLFHFVGISMNSIHW